MKDLNAYLAAEIVIDVINQWHMPLFFVLSGMAAFFAFRRRSAKEYAAERVARLLVPLLFGILIAVLPQVYLERISPDVPRRMSPIDFEGGFLAFIPEFFKPPYPERNFSYHHLWFIWYLFLYSLFLTPVFALLSRPETAEGGGALRRVAREGLEDRPPGAALRRGRTAAPAAVSVDPRDHR